MSKMNFKRRDALKGLLALGGSAAGLGTFGALDSLAQDTPEGFDSRQRFIFCYFPGAWDILLSLDPRRMVDFPSDAIAETRIQPAYDMVELADAGVVRVGDVEVGPYLGERMLEHVPRMCIVRGVSMDTLAHEVGRRRFITGKAPAGLLARGSSIATWLAGSLGLNDAIPNLAVQVETYNRDLPPAASGFRVSSAADLVRGLRADEPVLDPRQEAVLNHFHNGASACGRARRSRVWRTSEGGRVQSRQMLEMNLGELFDLNQGGELLEELRGDFGISGRVTTATPEVQSLLAYQAITGGVSRCVSISVSEGLDTHFGDWARVQGPRQRRGFDAVARLISRLATTRFEDTDDYWLDHTTVVLFSEFSRTPLLNPQEGRDHSLTNAIAMVGGRTRPGVVGASSNIGMEPQAIDLDTGELDRGGEVPKPEHILRGLMVNAGIEEDIADLRVDGLPAAFRT